MVSPMTEPTIQDSLATTLAEGDRVRWLASRASPPAARGALLALYSFALELGRTRDVVREAMLGQIRLAWWREALEGPSGSGPQEPYPHPVIAALAPVLGDGRLTLADLTALIDARSMDLEEEPPATLAALEAYAAETGGRLCQLAAKLVGVADCPPARLFGTAHALAGLALAVPFRAAVGRVDLPRDLLDAAGVHPTALVQQRSVERAAPVVRAVCERAAALLSEARATRPDRAAIPALLPAIAAQRWLTRLEAAGYNPWDPTLGRPDPWLGAAIAWAAWRGRV